MHFSLKLFSLFPALWNNVNTLLAVPYMHQNCYALGNVCTFCHFVFSTVILPEFLYSFSFIIWKPKLSTVYLLFS